MINRISKLAIVDETSYSAAAAAVNTSTEVITISAHGLVDGCKLRYDDTNLDITGLTDQSDYFVINATTNTFQLSATRGGSAVNLTAASGSGTFLYVSPIYLSNINGDRDWETC